MSTIILFTGLNGPELRTALAKTIADFVAHDGELNVTTFDTPKVVARDVLSACEALPFLGSRRLVVVRDLDFTSSSAGELAEGIEQLPEHTTLLFVAEDPDGRSALLKKIKKIGEIREFATPEKKDFRGWLSLTAKQIELTLEPHALDLLALYTAGNCEQATQELHKLKTYAGATPVTKADIQQLVTPDLHTTIFQLTDDLGAKKTENAIATLTDLIRRGENLVQTLYMLARHIRILLQIKACEGKPAASIASELKIHPFVVQKSLAQVRNFSITELIQAHAAVLLIDTGLKTGKIHITTMDQTELALELEKLIVKMA